MGPTRRSVDRASFQSQQAIGVSFANASCFVSLSIDRPTDRLIVRPIDRLSAPFTRTCQPACLFAPCCATRQPAFRTLYSKKYNINNSLLMILSLFFYIFICCGFLNIFVLCELELKFSEIETKTVQRPVAKPNNNSEYEKVSLNRNTKLSAVFCFRFHFHFCCLRNAAPN